MLTMKKYFLLFFLSGASLLAAAQTKNTHSPLMTEYKNKIAAQDKDITIYKLALQYGDYDEAKHALYSLIARNPDNKGYLDSLVSLYYGLNAYAQCVLSGNTYLSKDSTNLQIMEMVALSDNSLKRHKEAAGLYEKMYMQTGRIYYAYHLAVQQYFLKRVGECNQMIDIIINDPRSMKETIPISGDDSRQNVPMKAAALNLRGIVLSEVNMPDKAKENFEAALKAFPEFTLAKKNLDALNEKKDQDSLPGNTEPKK